MKNRDYLMSRAGRCKLAIGLAMLMVALGAAGCIDFSIPAVDSGTETEDDSATLQEEASDDDHEKDTASGRESDPDSGTGDSDDFGTDTFGETDTATDKEKETESGDDTGEKKDTASGGESDPDSGTGDSDDFGTDTFGDTDTATDKEKETESGDDTDEKKDTASESDTGAGDSEDIGTDTFGDTDTDTFGDSDTVVEKDTFDFYSDFGSDAFEGGFDSRPTVVPILLETGGRGNVTASGDVDDPLPSDGGACNYGNTEIYNYAAINVNENAGDGLGQWDSGRICGECARVTVVAAERLESIVVRITDRCADDICGVQLGGRPAQTVMGDFPGVYLGAWEFVPCNQGEGVSDGPAAIYVKEGSDEWWSRIHIRNPPAAVQVIEWRSISSLHGEFTYNQTPENYWTVPSTVLQTHADITLKLHFSFGITITHTLPGNDLAEAGALIELPEPD